MWDNIGGKLQGLAKVVCWIGIIFSVIMAIVLWTQNSSYRPTILSGFLYLVLGGLGSWIGSWALYGLGIVVEYVERTGSFASSTGSAMGAVPTEDGGMRLTGTSYWVCPKCKNRNPFSKIECKECGTIRS